LCPCRTSPTPLAKPCNPLRANQHSNRSTRHCRSVRIVSADPTMATAITGSTPSCTARRCRSLPPIDPIKPLLRTAVSESESVYLRRTVRSAPYELALRLMDCFINEGNKAAPHPLPPISPSPVSPLLLSCPPRSPHLALSPSPIFPSSLSTSIYLPPVSRLARTLSRALPVMCLRQPTNAARGTHLTRSVRGDRASLRP
jgi:hypothetical protein